MIIESVSLSFTDLTGAKTGCSTLGSNKFWKGWVEENAGVHSFECRWGATGTPGNDKGSLRGISLGVALNTLAKKSAEKIKKGYTRLDIRSDAEEMAKQAVSGVVAAAPVPVLQTNRRAFHPKVGQVLATIYGSTSATVRSGLSAAAGTSVANPMGNLSDAQLDVGAGILDDLEDALKSLVGPAGASNASVEAPLDGSGRPDPRILNLTNQFLSAIPREIPLSDRGVKNLHKLVLSSYTRVAAQRDFLRLLRDTASSKAVFAAAAAQTGSSGKEEVWYDGLGCEIEYLDPTSPEFKRVVEIANGSQSTKNANWWRNGRCLLKVVDVYRYTRKGTEAPYERFASQVTARPGAVGRIMAWHGTRTPNLMGISRSGLLMPENLPKGVHISGKAFGRGIYHAPAWNASGHRNVGSMPTDGTNGLLKSANYTSLSGAYYGSGSGENAGFLFLQDVALGVPECHTSACWDKPRPDHGKDFIFACGSRNNGGFVHDELVTFHQDAQKFSYLVKVTVG